MEYQPRINYTSNKIREPKEKHKDFQILKAYQSQKKFIQKSENVFRQYCWEQYQSISSADKKTIAQSDLIVAMPISASGDYENKYIGCILNKFKGQSLPQKNFAIVCLVNSKHQSDQEAIEALVGKIEDYKSKNSDQNIITLSANWSDDKFQSINMGYVRGFIYDSIILACIEEGKAKETAIVTFDSDVIDFSNKLLQSFYNRLIINGDKNEMIAGNGNWSGNTGNDIIDLQLIFHQVDSSLSNLDDVYNNIRHKYPSEGNSAFKLSTYCKEHYGPNYLNFGVCENTLILVGEHTKHSAFEDKALLDPTAWIKTNPRRFISQLENSNDLNQTWTESWDGLGEFRRNNQNNITSFNYSDDLEKFHQEFISIIKFYTQKYFQCDLEGFAGDLLNFFEANPEKKEEDFISQILLLLRAATKTF